MAHVTTLYLPKPVTRRRLLQSWIDPGRPVGRVPGGWIADLVGLKKSVALCGFCEGKWRPTSQGYRRSDLRYFVNDACDGCRTRATCKLFVHESVYLQVADPPRRTKGRWGTNLGWMPRWVRGEGR